MDTGVWWAIVLGVAESDMTRASEHTCAHFSYSNYFNSIYIYSKLSISWAIFSTYASLEWVCHARF